MWERLDDLKKSSGVAHRPCWTVVKVLVWSPDCACLVHRVDMGGDGFVGHSVSEGRLSFHQQPSWPVLGLGRDHRGDPFSFDVFRPTPEQSRLGVLPRAGTEGFSGLLAYGKWL